MRKKVVVTVLAAALVQAGIVAFIIELHCQKAIYSISVADYFARPLEGTVRVSGVLVPGSLCSRDTPCEFRFRLQDSNGIDARTLAVHYASCVIPDTFAIGSATYVRVTVEGEACPSCAELEVTQLFEMMPRKYELRPLEGAEAPRPRPALPTCPPR